MKCQLWKLFEAADNQFIDNMEVESVERGRAGPEKPWVIEVRDLEYTVYEFPDQIVELVGGACTARSLDLCDYKIKFKVTSDLTLKDLQPEPKARKVLGLDVTLSQAMANLRESIEEPVDLKYSDLVTLEVQPKSHDQRVQVVHRHFGWVCVNYTDEGLILDVLDAKGESVYENSFHADDLVDSDED